MVESLHVERHPSGGVDIFARNRLVVIASDHTSIPSFVRENLLGWNVDDRPFYVTVRPDGDGELNDLYGFEIPRRLRAPAWWREAVQAWDRERSESAKGRARE